MGGGGRGFQTEEEGPCDEGFEVGEEGCTGVTEPQWVGTFNWEYCMQTEARLWKARLGHVRNIFWSQVCLGVFLCPPRGLHGERGK